MQQALSISNLFRDLYDGKPWLEVNLVETLRPISAEKAVMRLHPIPNSIWELVNHIIAWRLNVLRRVQGEVLETPGHNYFEPVTDRSEAAWNNTLVRLEESQQRWLVFLETLDPVNLEKIYPRNGMTYFQHIHGIIQHDAYHLGQIVLLAKYVGE